jgi:hypothetical protein
MKVWNSFLCPARLYRINFNVGVLPLLRCLWSVGCELNRKLECLAAGARTSTSVYTRCERDVRCLRAVPLCCYVRRLSKQVTKYLLVVDV